MFNTESIVPMVLLLVFLVGVLFLAKARNWRGGSHNGDKRRLAVIGNHGRQAAKVALMAVLAFSAVLNSGCANRYENMRAGKWGWKSKTIALEAERACEEKPESERRACIEREIDKAGKQDTVAQLKAIPIVIGIALAAFALAAAIVH